MEGRASARPSLRDAPMLDHRTAVRADEPRTGRLGNRLRHERRTNRPADGAVAQQQLAQAVNRARVQLRDARLVRANLVANLLHRHFAEVVEAENLALA